MLPPGESLQVYAFSRRLFLAIMCKHDVIHKTEVHNVATLPVEGRATAIAYAK